MMQKSRLKYCIIIPYILMALSCSSQTDVMDNKTKNLDVPFAMIELPAELNEISGISYFGPDQLICHQDENAEIFSINYKTQKIEKLYNSELNADYEDIVYINGKIYLLQSNGIIHQFDDKFKTIKYSTNLDERNDCEGLTYDKSTNSLLIACKEKSTLKNEQDDLKHRYIYQFDLKTHKLIERPFLTINLEILTKDYGTEKFKPSGIAIHPKSGYIYILASAGKKIIVMDKQNKIIELIKLKSEYFLQPEGICFDPEGEFLFISNEGKKGIANLLIYKL